MSTMGLQLFQGRADYPALSDDLVETPGVDQGVYITIQAQAFDAIVAMFLRWFEHREEVEVVDYGTSDKQELGFVIIEWIESEIDQLFIDILASEDVVLDYTLYTREVQ